MTARQPSGAQYEIRHGDQRAVAVSVGASLRSYSAADRDVIVPFGSDEIAPASHGAVLLPWPNRLRDGRYTFGGVDYQVPLTEPSRQTALHGLACWQRWEPVERNEASVTLALDLVPTPGYPFPLHSEITYALGPGGLEVTLTTTNPGDGDAPYGAGFHPWLSPGPGPLDDCVLSIDADRWVSTDDRLLPVAAEPIPGHFDFRSPRTLGATQFDDAFVDATFSDGLSWIRLQGPDGATAATWMDESMTCWQVCTGDAVTAPGYRRAGLAAEPMSCIADAFRTGERLIRLSPGGASTVRWGMTLLR